MTPELIRASATVFVGAYHTTMITAPHSGNPTFAREMAKAAVVAFLEQMEKSDD
jgi:hypothetical protein